MQLLVGTLWVELARVRAWVWGNGGNGVCWCIGCALSGPIRRPAGNDLTTSCSFSPTPLPCPWPPLAPAHTPQVPFVTCCLVPPAYRLHRTQANGLKQYEQQRGLADGRAVSRLSPYLRSGQLSPRLLWSRLRQVR